MRRLPALLFVFVIGLGWGPAPTPVPAEEATALRLTLEEVLAPGRFLRTLPDWSWRPGHAQLVREASSPAGRVLLSMDPETGRVETLLSLHAVHDSVPGSAPPARGIGRAPAPRFVWSRDGDALCVVVRGDLVSVDLEAGTWRRLTETRSPLSDVTVSPGGGHVAFARDHDLWVVATGKGEPRPLTTGGGDLLRNAGLDWVYPEELGLRSGTAWSSDGTRLAFLRLDESGVTRQPLVDDRARASAVRWTRYPKTGTKNPVPSVAVVAAAGGEVVDLDLGTPRPEYVARLAWLPDGEHVAVVTFDRLQRTLRLLACPVDGGAPHTLLEERDAAWVDAPPAPLFLDATTFLWRSHREGYTRWYLGTLAEGAARASLVPITPPDIEVFTPPTVDLDARVVACTGTKLGERRARPYVGDLDAPAAARPPAGTPPPTHDVQAKFGPAARHALVTWSTSWDPPRRALIATADGRVVRDLGRGASPAFEDLALPTPEVGELDDGVAPVTWRLWWPREPGGGRPRPVIVRVYAGPGSRIVKGGWDRSIFLTTYLTQRGYFVLEVDGRGSRGRGAAHERAVHGRLGVRELEDQVRVVRHLAARPYLDGERVGITGWSFGGTMTCLAMTKAGDVFRAGVAIAPVTDWTLYDTIYTERYMGLPADNADGYRESAAVHGAATMNGPLLLLHGTADDNVHVQNAHRFLDALVREEKKGVEAMIYPGCGHGLGGVHHDVYERLFAFFDEHLR